MSALYGIIRIYYHIEEGRVTMRVWFVFSLLFSVLVAIFAVLNSNVVLIKLYWVDYQLSQSLVIILSAFLGALIATFLGVFGKIKSTLKIHELNSVVKTLEQKIIELTKQTTELKIGDPNVKSNATGTENSESKTTVY